MTRCGATSSAGAAPRRHGAAALFSGCSCSRWPSASSRWARCSSTCRRRALPARLRSCSTSRPRSDPDDRGRPAGHPRDDLPGHARCSSSRSRSASARRIYLEEYADQDRWYNRLLELNIQNLAARAVDRLRHPRARVPRPRPRPRPGAAGRRAHPHAARAADRDHRRARGDPRRAATRSARAPTRSARRSGRSIWRQVLPAAIPGIATGSILALSRAIGETAPLLLVGALDVRRASTRP